jgi:hypothetical protein
VELIAEQLQKVIKVSDVTRGPFAINYGGNTANTERDGSCSHVLDISACFL